MLGVLDGTASIHEVGDKPMTALFGGRAPQPPGETAVGRRWVIAPVQSGYALASLS